jgi:hypothetical protein
VRDTSVKAGGKQINRFEKYRIFRRQEGNTRAGPKLIPRILLCRPATSGAVTGGMAAEVEPSRQ